MIEVNFLFVYGKLREFYSDKENFDIESLITMPARTKGLLYEFDGDGVLVEDDLGGNAYVYGNLVAATDIDKLLRHSDSFMEYVEDDFGLSKYVRCMKEAEIQTLGEDIKVWCYVFPSSKRYTLEKQGKIIESGDWIKYKEENKK